MEKKFICIVCPMGCELTAETDKQGNLTAVAGNRCKRGESYAEQECKTPMRMLTSTVRIEKALYQRLPVITSASIPKDMIFQVMSEIDRVKIEAPVELRQIIIKNVCGLSADIIASRSMAEVHQ
ncbi:DUF1667 domain-containing protein [Clostridiales bacterium COT073_COT-073]|nr:DUF1667 domain-containing protein [Clostridiales bacterium COT073_COT-073]